jgi:hypothetical protein
LLKTFSIFRLTPTPQKIFVDKGFASEIAVLEKEYGKGVVGDTQLEMTAFQKQVLVLEESRQAEEAREGNGNNTPGPAGQLNARHPTQQGESRVERIQYKNNGTHETENQAEFVDSE